VSEKGTAMEMEKGMDLAKDLVQVPASKLDREREGRRR
jgi:hypothetical protein